MHGRHLGADRGAAVMLYVALTEEPVVLFMAVVDRVLSGWRSRERGGG